MECDGAGMSGPSGNPFWDVHEHITRLQNAVIKLAAWQGIDVQDLYDEELLQEGDMG